MASNPRRDRDLDRSSADDSARFYPALYELLELRVRRELDADGVPIERTIPGGFARATLDDL